MEPVNREKTPDRAVGSLGHLGYLTLFTTEASEGIRCNFLVNFVTHFWNPFFRGKAFVI